FEIPVRIKLQDFLKFRPRQSRQNDQVHTVARDLAIGLSFCNVNDESRQRSRPSIVARVKSQQLPTMLRQAITEFALNVLISGKADYISRPHQTSCILKLIQHSNATVPNWILIVPLRQQNIQYQQVILLLA